MGRGRRVRTAPWAIAVWAIAVAGGCQLFMNLDVGGYGPVPETCDGDAACAQASLTCLSARDCDGGQVCCLGAPSQQGDAAAAVAACQASPCGFTSVQLCSGNAECGSGVTCAPCSLEGIFSLSICGSSVECSH